jgi:hypothetical protein
MIPQTGILLRNFLLEAINRIAFLGEQFQDFTKQLGHHGRPAKDFGALIPLEG